MGDRVLDVPIWLFPPLTRADERPSAAASGESAQWLAQVGDFMSPFAGLLSFKDTEERVLRDLAARAWLKARTAPGWCGSATTAHLERVTEVRLQTASRRLAFAVADLKASGVA